MLEYCTTCSSSEIEITMIGQIDWCWTISGRFVVDDQRSVCLQKIGDRTVNSTGKTTLLSRAVITENHPRIIAKHEGLGTPVVPAPVRRATMESIRPFIGL